MIPGSANPLLLKSAAAAGGYQIERSLRFNSADSAYLSRTPAVAGNRRTWTWAGWVKRSELAVGGQAHSLFAAGGPGNDAGFYFTGGDTIEIYYYAGAYQYRKSTTQVFRDTSAWYHLVQTFDTNNATPDDRVRLYVNGIRVTTFAASINPGLGYSSGLINSTTQHTISSLNNTARWLGGYLADIHFIDGQALTPSSFTEVSATTGQLIPKAYAGTYTGNSFWLKFNDNSAATATTLGKDSFLLGNNWTPNNLSVVGGPSTVTTPASNAPPTVDYLVVAGGGGGSGELGGGGGAGGLRSTVTATGGGGALESALTLTTGTSYTVTVGAGGSGGTATNGGNSVFGSITSIGGGRGGNNTVPYDADSGGSGGGARANTAGTAPAGAGTANQGFAGGTASAGSSGNRPTGGGGGAGAVGANGTNGAAGNGGAGVVVAITGSSVTYGGGGGGGSSGAVTAGSGGAGGGGAGGQAGVNGTSGTANTGGGGGGSDSSPATGGAGGSGIVVIRYANTYDDLIVGGGLTYTYANTGGYKIYSFTASATAAQAAGNDSLVDTPTSYGTPDTGVGNEVRGNYATLNPLAKGSSQTLANGNLDISGDLVYGHTKSTLFVSSGKWYFEYTLGTFQGDTGMGLANSSAALTTFSGENTSSVGYLADGRFFYNSSSTSYSSYTTGDVIGVAFDCDTGKIWIAKNNTWQNSGNPAAGTGQVQTVSWPDFTPIARTVGSGAISANFGQRQWAYAAPAGFKALCDTNLPAPLVALPNTVMDVKLYTGNGSTQTISGLAFSPDFVWIKTRSASGYAHILQDTVRGAGKSLASQNTNAELGNAGDFIGSFNSDGFSVNTTYLSGTAPETNGNGDTFVGWAWDAGSSTVSNTQGSITSQVRANVSAGFSIVTYTGNGTDGATVGHGLGVTPGMIIVKIRESSSGGNHGWVVAHSGLTNYNALFLNETAAAYAGPGRGWINPYGSSTFTLKAGNGGTSLFDNVNQNGKTYVAYAFAPVVGYSSFGSYTGTSGQNFVHLGFRPKLLMIKNSSNGSFPAYTGWAMFDSSRSTYNVNTNALWANSSQQEGLRGNGGAVTTADFAIDLLSNGFCLRDNGASEINLSGNTYIFAAWAENPFAYARAR